MKFNNLILNIENDPRIQRLFGALVPIIPKIPVMATLIAQATKDGPVTVNFVSQAESPTGGSIHQHGQIRGNVKTIEKTIRVVKENKSFAEMFATFVFELCNAKNPQFELFSPQQIDPKKYADRDAYAKAVETAEFSQTHMPARQILKQIASDPNVVALLAANNLSLSSQELRQLQSNAMPTFDHWWKNVNLPRYGNGYSHSDVYRTAFDRAVPARVPVKVSPVAQTSAPSTPVAKPAPSTPVARPAPSTPMARPAPSTPMARSVGINVKVAREALRPMVNPIAQVNPHRANGQPILHCHRRKVCHVRPTIIVVHYRITPIKVGLR